MSDQRQEGGTHYVDMEVQPWDVIKATLTSAEWIGFLKGNVIKYGMRQGRKDSPDGAKARHYIEKLAEEYTDG